MIYCVVFSLLAAITYYVGKKAYRYSLNPLSCLLGVFFAATALFYASDFIDHGLSFKTIMVYAAGLSMFCLGLFISYHIKTAQKPCTADGSYSVMPYNGGGFEKATHYNILKVGFALSVVIIVLNVWYIVYEVGVSAYFSNVFISIDDNLVDKGFSYKLLVYLKKALLIFSPMAIDYALRYKEKKAVCFGFAIVNILLSVSYSRVMLFYALIMDVLAIYFYFRREKKKKGSWKFTILTITVVIIAIAFFANSQQEMNKVFNITGKIGNLDLSDSGITMLSYFIGPLKSTDVYIANGLESMPLAATFRYVYEILGIDTISSVGVPFVTIPFTYNTAVAMFYMYREGGFIWLFIASFFFGYISNKIFKDYLHNDTADKMVTAAFLILCLLMSIRSYMPMFLEFWIPLIALVIIRARMKNARRKDEKNQPKEACQ